jgi:hypothetical protein
VPGTGCMSLCLGSQSVSRRLLPRSLRTISLGYVQVVAVPVDPQIGGRRTTQHETGANQAIPKKIAGIRNTDAHTNNVAFRTIGNP